MKIKKITALLLCVCMMMFMLCSCGEDLQREQYTDKIDVAIKAEPTSIASLQPELTEIAHEYDDDSVLVEVFANFNKKQIATEKGTLSFSFVSNVEDKNRVTIVIVTYDMETKKATKVSFDEGNGILSDQSDKPIEETITQVAFASLFESVKNDSNMSSKLNGANVNLTMEFTQKIECKVL